MYESRLSIWNLTVENQDSSSASILFFTSKFFVSFPISDLIVLIWRGGNGMQRDATPVQNLFALRIITFS